MNSAQNWPPCLQAALDADNHETLRVNLQIAAGVIAEMQRRVSDREAELMRCRTHEAQAAHLLDQQLSPEERAKFASLCNRIAELEQSPTFADAVRVVEEYQSWKCGRDILDRLRALQ